MNYKNNQEFREWLRKGYACCECGKELFFLQKEEITTNYYVDPFQIESNKRKKIKKCAECCKEKADQWKKVSLIKPAKEFYEDYHKEKLRKMPIPAADREKVIEFYKQKCCSPELKCSQCGDYSITIGEEDDGTKRIYDENYSDKNGIYCSKCIQEKNWTGNAKSSSYLYDVWEEWKKENNQTSSLQPNMTTNKSKNENTDNFPAGKIKEKTERLEKNEAEKTNNSLLFTILIAA